eukprot:259185_1
MAETELAMHISDHDERVAYDPTSAIGKSMTMIEHEKTTPFKEHMRTVADAIALSCADIAIIGALVFSSGIGTISAHLQLQFSEDDVMDILTQCFLYLSVIMSGSGTSVLGMLFFFFKMLPARGLHKYVRYFEEISHKPRLFSMVLVMVSLGFEGVGGICFLIDIQGFSIATIVVISATVIAYTLIMIFVLKFGATYLAIIKVQRCKNCIRCLSCKIPKIENAGSKIR